MIERVGLYIHLIVLLYVCCGSRESIVLQLSIPAPGGIFIEKAFGAIIAHNHSSQSEEPQREVFRVGRIQHSAISVRPSWAKGFVIDNVLTPEECQSIIIRGESHARRFGWSRGRHTDYDYRPTQDNSVEKIFNTTSSTLEMSTQSYVLLINRLNDAILSQYAPLYGLKPSHKLKIDDLFFTKYDSAIPPKHHLARHCDMSIWSFVLALNDNFVGGGTYFYDSDQTLNPPTGSAVIFNGQDWHGGAPIASGVRYILAGFLDVIDPDNHDAFMDHYDPIYDGFAAAHGFRSNDIIIGVEVCDEISVEEAQEAHKRHVPLVDGHNTLHLGHEGVGDASSDILSDALSRKAKFYRRRMVDINPTASDEEWSAAFLSCSSFASDQPTSIKVRRLLTENGVTRVKTA